ncbi:hypothetical protein [Mesorhizobium sp. INR15]|uniref:hypothetical protein n=1 Tax=Mesorhizobium sp. INR15 TaxID=2654248 RepID=UPI0018967B41|nr:hypothetical protein [Mesorhizobium sp. INR15]QPC94429.1 hypothetical protein GA829_29665 [Mesorhizobium sp. INR15]
MKAQTEAQYAVHFANRELVRRDWRDPVYVAARQALESVNVDLYKAKWQLGRMDGTYADFALPLDPADNLAATCEVFQSIVEAANRIADACRNDEVVAASPPAVSRRPGTETNFSDDIPLVPAICPVVVLQGSNRDMGRQYAQQVIEIYGNWVFARQAERVLTEAELVEMRKWEAELRRYMPEVLDFVQGWADGATAAGATIAYDNVLAIWTGTRPFSKEIRPFAFADSDKVNDKTIAAYLGVGTEAGQPRGEITDMCSGVCAWGGATTDGKLVAAATTDHDCTFQATIVAFPDQGNNFIYTPFSVKGSIPVIGRDFMGGHPGMNSKGVAYVHHGGASTGEPRDQWGYGVRRGPATFHTLQFANTAVEARDMQLSWPVGDAGITLGTAGGMYADSTHAFSFEARSGSPDKPNPIIREATYDALGKPHDFLYANNNALSPRSAHLNAAPAYGYQYSLAGGWFTFDPKVIYEEPGGIAIRRLLTKESEGRNRFHYRIMMEGYGRVDFDYLTALYRTSGEIPAGDFKDVSARWDAGEQWNCSPAHRSIASTFVIRPDAENTGTYQACIGPAERSLNCRDPGHGYYYYDETNAFWELTLAASPEEVSALARNKAKAHVEAATEALRGFDGCQSGRAELQRLLRSAEVELTEAGGHQPDQDVSDARLAALARSVRASTRSQVRARQVSEAVTRPKGLDVAKA